MIEKIAVPLRDVKRRDYAMWQWLDVTSLGDTETMLVRGPARLPADAIKAWDDWKIWRNIVDGTGIYNE